MNKQTPGSRARWAVCLLVVLAAVAQQPAHAQFAPGVLDSVQQSVDRQAERARERAADRAREQAAERAQQQATDRTLNQAVDRVSEQASDRAQSQVSSVQERVLERAREQASERAAEQAVEQAVEQAAGQAGAQIERVQSRVSERAQNQAERAQQRLEQLPAPAQRAQGAVIERVQENAERARATLGSAAQANRAHPGSAIGADARARPQSPRIGPPARAALPRAGAQATVSPRDLLPPLPERLEVTGQDGQPAFVEIQIEPNIRVREREWVMMINQEQRVQLNAQAAELLRFLVREDSLTTSGRELLTFRVPPDLDSGNAVLDLVPVNLRPFIDRNHVYQTQMTSESPESGLLPMPMAPVCEDAVGVGIIDSRIDTQHPALNGPGRSTSVIQRSFLDEGLLSPASHGTAVAGVLIGRSGELMPVLPNARVYSATVVYEQDTYRQGSSVMSIIQALDWLSGQPVSVINMSLTGPANRLLDQALENARQRGKVLVAAAGNNGPHADPLFPAAYPQVLAVTAVGQNRQIYRWANQGDHIDFAAYGVNIPTAGKEGQVRRESGTSLAAPVVAAFLACQINAAGDEALALTQLRALAEDLGDTGRDPVFGDGLLHP